jgi:hypothetical protein
MGADNQAERVIEALEFETFLCGVLFEQSAGEASLETPTGRKLLARRIIEAIREEGRRWSV